MSQFDPKDMLLFSKVVEAGSLSAASRLTSRPKATISRAIVRLEDRLKARLLERTARHMSVTEAGKIFYEYCLRVNSVIEEAESAVNELQRTVRGTLKIGSTLTIGRTFLNALIPDFVARHPDLKVKLELTNRTIDLIEEGFDIVLRIGPLADSSLVAKHLAALSYGVYSSPHYLQHSDPLVHPNDFAGLGVVDNFLGKESSTWQFRRGTEVADVKVTPKLDFNDAIMRRDALIKGSGIGMLPNLICKEAIATGQLVNVLAEWHSTHTVSIYAVWPSRLYLSPRLRAFLDYLHVAIPRLLA